MEQPGEHSYKSKSLKHSVVVMVGDTSVGKTCLISQYIKGSIPAQKAPTVGVEFSTKAIRIDDKTTVKAQIWDTAGQEKYKAITSALLF